MRYSQLAAVTVGTTEIVVTGMPADFDAGYVWFEAYQTANPEPTQGDLAMPPLDTTVDVKASENGYTFSEVVSGLDLSNIDYTRPTFNGGIVSVKALLTTTNVNLTHVRVNVDRYASGSLPAGAAPIGAAVLSNDTRPAIDVPAVWTDLNTLGAVAAGTALELQVNSLENANDVLEIWIGADEPAADEFGIIVKDSYRIAQGANTVWGRFSIRSGRDETGGTIKVQLIEI